MLQPRVEVLRGAGDSDGEGELDHGGCPSGFEEKQWDAWFVAYWKMLRYYARLAQQEGVEMLAVNSGLYCASRQASRA
eukprot:204655-Prorocentrum_minimum.AAC.3